MLTQYGRAVRKLRIDANMTAREMAKKVGLTASFLSAVETGRKPVPADLVTKVAAALNLSEEEKTKLRQAAEKSKKEFRIAAGKSSTDRDRELLEMFARGFNNLTEERKDAIRRILGANE